MLQKKKKKALGAQKNKYACNAKINFISTKSLNSAKYVVKDAKFAVIEKNVKNVLKIITYLIKLV